MVGNTALTHQSAEPLERARDTYVRVDLNEDTFCRMDVDLQKTSLV
jgi:hypothetical protein